MYSKVYFDTAPLIYFLDKREPYFSKVENFIADIFVTNDKQLLQVKEVNPVLITDL